ncbi:hypothetical protein KPSA3_06924 [Pseudomonas syringae pv. actinidiae]|uniref:Uncharacterized protein n=1 Tax=Pseudomonas syringae pv. actinidiae TaxID=103796 RepID=A0AAN4QBZ0_PSESF|nr:hypothetical protein KPSA3_06924 [Pseudomonas syringae pv. actinidiae]
MHWLYQRGFCRFFDHLVKKQSLLACTEVLEHRRAGTLSLQ